MKFTTIALVMALVIGTVVFIHYYGVAVIAYVDRASRALAHIMFGQSYGLRMDELAADYQRFCREEEQRLGWRCGASPEARLACHAVHPNAAYFGWCARCHDGIRVLPTETEEIQHERGPARVADE